MNEERRHEENEKWIKNNGVKSYKFGLQKLMAQVGSWTKAAAPKFKAAALMTHPERRFQGCDTGGQGCGTRTVKNNISPKFNKSTSTMKASILQAINEMFRYKIGDIFLIYSSYVLEALLWGFWLFKNILLGKKLKFKYLKWYIISLI